ncbi:MAG TPA: hypothetical protein VKZ53_25700 [Candidatus Angelobacter sp.]|nr:hypothetical protein [Candidatus Angelobacter sp.]
MFLSDATNIFQAANGLLAMSKLAGGQSQNDPDLVAVMNGIEVKQNGSHVVVSVVVPINVIQRVEKKARALVQIFL